MEGKIYANKNGVMQSEREQRGEARRSTYVSVEEHFLSAGPGGGECLVEPSEVAARVGDVVGDPGVEGGPEIGVQRYDTAGGGA